MDLSSDYNNLSAKELDEEPEHCDFCQEPIKDDEEPRNIFDGKDETLTLCESCASHYLENIKKNNHYAI